MLQFPGPPQESCSPATRAVRAAICTDSQHGAVVPPIHLSSTFSFEGLGGKRTYDYTRSGNPTRDHLGEALAWRPIPLGADLVVHSTTKYLNGHSDVVGGAVVARTPELLQEVAWWANCLGLTGSPFDSFLTLRGLRTLHARIRVHQENALALVARLASHPEVGEVYHPSLSTHPGHQIAARQQDGFGAMLSFTLRGGEAAVRAFVEGLTCMTLAESLGGVESLVAHPASMTHASMTVEARGVAGIGDDLLRISVGIEDPRDLLRDLEAALGRAERARAAGDGPGPGCAGEAEAGSPPRVDGLAAD